MTCAQKDKVYVQHRIKELGGDIWKLVHEEKATFFVCG